jgi:class 3 adenylate cyclase
MVQREGVMNTEDAVAVQAHAATPCLVAMIDTRGFSEFAQNQNDPVAVAGYVSRTTKHILRTLGDSSLLADYVVKPLGDGLLFILNLERSTQENMANSALIMLRALLAVSSRFRNYLEGDPPPGVSEIPSSLGIGLAFGPLVRLSVQSSKPKVEFDDYIGHTINLAARLQEVARTGGCVAHTDVYEKIFKHDPDAADYFLRVLNQTVEVRLRNMGTLDVALVYTNAQIPPEYQKSKADETKVEEFSKAAISALKTTYARKRSQESGRRQLPELTRFMLFRREATKFREIVEYMVGQRITFKTDVTVAVDQQGVCPIADAVLTGDPVMVSYTVKYDECDETDPDNEYWRQTNERFPRANIDALRKLNLHPASILAIPLDPDLGSISAVAAFDSTETDVFNNAIREEIGISLPVLYGQFFGSGGAEAHVPVEL